MNFSISGAKKIRPWTLGQALELTWIVASQISRALFEHSVSPRLDVFRFQVRRDVAVRPRIHAP
jgi:hypothetical protein